MEFPNWKKNFSSVCSAWQTRIRHVQVKIRNAIHLSQNPLTCKNKLDNDEGLSGLFMLGKATGPHFQDIERKFTCRSFSYGKGFCKIALNMMKWLYISLVSFRTALNCSFIFLKDFNRWLKNESQNVSHGDQRYYSVAWNELQTPCKRTISVSSGSAPLPKYAISYKP